jgi:hypothetical protein
MHTLVLDERPNVILFSRMETIFEQSRTLTGQDAPGITSLQGCSVLGNILRIRRTYVLSSLSVRHTLSHFH